MGESLLRMGFGATCAKQNRGAVHLLNSTQPLQTFTVTVVWFLLPQTLSARQGLSREKSMALAAQLPQVYHHEDTIPACGQAISLGVNS